MSSVTWWSVLNLSLKQHMQNKSDVDISVQYFIISLGKFKTTYSSSVVTSESLCLFFMVLQHTIKNKIQMEYKWTTYGQEQPKNLAILTGYLQIEMHG